MPGQEEVMEIVKKKVKKIPKKMKKSPIKIEIEGPVDVSGGTATGTDEPEGQATMPKAEEIALLKDYGQKLKGTNEYAMEFVCNQVQHPVISCLRELTQPDLNMLIGNNKIKKRNGSLEQSIIYLGLIDYIAVSLDNSLYTEKRLKNVPSKVQKIMLDFKNIIGAWGLSDTPMFKERYATVMKYLRGLVHYFKPVNFDETFSKILDSIESEIGRNRQNYEKIRFLSSSTIPSVLGSPGESDTSSKKTEVDENEIDLNICLNVEEHENEEDDPCPMSPTLTWATLKPPRKNDNNKRRGKAKKVLESKILRKKSRLDMIMIEEEESYRVSESSTDSESISPPPKKKATSKVKKSLKKITLPEGPLAGPSKIVSETEQESPLQKRLKGMEDLKTSPESVSQSPTKSKSSKTATKRTTKATNKSPKKPRLDVIDVTIQVKQRAELVTRTNSNTGDADAANKPKVNAFALLMSRSREIAEEKKKKKLASA